MNKLSQEYLAECKLALDSEQTKSLSTTDNWAHDDRELVHKDWDVLYKKLAGYANEVAVDDIKVQTLMKEHFDIACRFYTPSKKAYIGMALFYRENEPMKNFHNGYHPEMVSYLGDAMAYYANKVL